MTLKDLENYKAPIPKSWVAAFGIWKDKGIDPLKYQKKIRAEWQGRWKKQVRLGLQKKKQK